MASPRSRTIAAQPETRPVAARPALRASGRALGESVRSGRLSARDLVESHIQRLQETRTVLNAVVWDRFDAARAEADAVDDAVAKGEGPDLGAFAGVPCSVKECFAFPGKPQTSGLVARRNHIAVDQATTIGRMRATGAIVLAGTNVSELCMWMESDNHVYGQTKNPYDPSRLVGGSSGGEGAVIGAGGSVFGLGSDVGGSIRMPAFFNGVFGHKPSAGLIPNSGQFPMADNEVQRYCTTGPLARRAEDLYPLVLAMAGADGIDTCCENTTIGDPANVDISALRVLNVADNGVIAVSAALSDAQNRAAAALGALGAANETRTFEGLRQSLGIWMTMLQAAGGKSFSDMLFVANPTTTMWRETLRFVFGRSPHTLPALALAGLERLGLSNRASAALLDEARSLRAALDAALGDDGVMLYPSYPVTAPRHRAPFWPPFKGARSSAGFALSADWTYTAILNVMELPATQVPLGLDAQGLPLGVQVVAAHGNDHLTLAVASALEKSMGGWVPPWEAGPRAVR